MKMRLWFSVAVALAAALVISCGGGGGPGPLPPPPPPPPIDPDVAWTAPFNLATDQRIQALALGLTNHADIFGFDDDPDAPPARPLSPVAPEGSQMLSIETVAGPGGQVSIRVETGVLIPLEEGPHFVNIPGSHPDGGLFEEFTGYNPSWGPGLGLSAEIINFQVGDTIRFVGELLDMGLAGGWPTDGPWQQYADPIPEGMGFTGRWWPADGTPRLTLTVGVMDRHGEHDRILPNREIWFRTATGPFDHTITLTPADITAIARAHAELIDEDEVPSIRLGLAGLNMAMRVDNIVFTPIDDVDDPCDCGVSGCPVATCDCDDGGCACDCAANDCGGIGDCLACECYIPPLGAYDGIEITIVGEQDTVTVMASIAPAFRHLAKVDDDSGDLYVADVSAVWSATGAYILLEFADPPVLNDFFNFSMSWDTGIATGDWIEWTGPYFAFELLYDLDTGSEPIADGSGWTAGPANTVVTTIDLRGNTDPIVGIRILGSQGGGFAFDSVTLYDITLEWREPPVSITVNIDGAQESGQLVVGELDGTNIIPVNAGIEISLDDPVAMATGFSVEVSWGGTALASAWFAVSLRFDCGAEVSLATWFGNVASPSSFTFNYGHWEDWSDQFASVTGDLVGIVFVGFGTSDPLPHITALSISTGP